MYIFVGPFPGRTRFLLLLVFDKVISLIFHCSVGFGFLGLGLVFP